MPSEDLRIIKTRKAIRDTFIEMRKTLPVEKIHVRELCRNAMINKSTFYNHYVDIFALENELEDEAIEQFLSNFEDKDCLLTEPLRFLTKMPPVFDANMERLLPLFRENMDAAFFKLEEKLRQIYETPDMPQEDRIRLSFILNGTMHTLRELKFGEGCDEKMFISSLAELIQKTAKSC